MGHSDAVLANLRGDVARRLGLTYDALGKVKADIVCVNISAFGTVGSASGRPGYDYLIQALTGWMELTGEQKLKLHVEAVRAEPNDAAWEAALGDRRVVQFHPLPQGAYELKAGDEILEIAGVEVPKFKPEDGESADWLAFRESLPDLAGLDYLVRRDGSEMQVEGPYLYPPMVGSVAPRSAASDIGLEPGDVITSIDGDEVWSFDALKDKVEGSDGKVLLLKVWRAGETLDFALAPRRTDEPQAEGGFKTNWRIGVVSEMAFEPATESPGFFEAIWGAMVQVRDIVVTSISGLWHMITGAISTEDLLGNIFGRFCIGK